MSYLAEKEIGAILRFISEIPKAEIVFDYMEPIRNYPRDQRALIAAWYESLAASDEPWLSHFDPIELGLQLSDLGFEEIVDLNLRAMAQRYATLIEIVGVGVGVHVIRAKLPGCREDEIAAYDVILARFKEATALQLRELVASTLVNKGVALSALGRREDAIAAYDDLLARFNEATGLRLRELQLVAKALFNKGATLGALGRREDAIAAYDDLVACFGAATGSPLRELVANAIFNKGLTLGLLGHSPDTISAYDDLLVRFNQATELPMRELVANALVNKGGTLSALGRSEDAIAVYDKLLARSTEGLLTVEREIQVSWRVVVRGEASPKQHSFDEEWLTDPRISDADIVCCNTVETECLSPADSLSEFSRLPNPATSVLILIPRKSAPVLEESWDGNVGSFIAPVGLIRAFCRSRTSECFSCFDLLHWALNNRSHGVSFECLQVPLQSRRPGGATTWGSSAQWIIPHKGPLFMLETCLRSVGESRVLSDAVSVCFDEETTHEHHEFAERYPWVEFYRSTPHSNGPYVSRERFLRSDASPVVLFQDSDDAPTVSRRRALVSQLVESGADLIGSHELRVNEVSRKVHAIRYPLDASAAIAASGEHTLLFPTSAGRRQAIKAAGGFSTN